MLGQQKKSLNMLSKVQKKNEIENEYVYNVPVPVQGTNGSKTFINIPFDIVRILE